MAHGESLRLRATQPSAGTLCVWRGNEWVSTGAPAAVLVRAKHMDGRLQNRNERRQLERGHVRLIAAPRMLDQSPEAVAQRADDRRLDRNRRKAQRRKVSK